jgi:hypothetical protein
MRRQPRSVQRLSRTLPTLLARALRYNRRRSPSTIVAAWYDQMDKTAISALISELLREDSAFARGARKNVPAGASAEVADALYEHYRALPLQELVSSQPEFPGGAGYMLSLGNGSYGFHSMEASKALLRYAAEKKSSDAAVDWLDRLLSTDVAQSLDITTLWGVRVSRSVELNSDFRLVPIDELPDSINKRRLTESATQIFDNVMSPRYFGLSPQAALIKSTSISPFLRAARSVETELQRARRRRRMSAEPQEVLLALACLGPCAPTAALAWSQLVDPDLARAVPYTGVMMSHVDPLPMLALQPVDLASFEAPLIVQKYLATKGDLRAGLHISLGRLARAMRSNFPGDKALDLAIAAESLLAGRGFGEYRYKVSLRAGLLTEGPLETKLRSRAVGLALYDLRSKVAHTGKPPVAVDLGKFGKSNPDEFLQESAQLVAKLIERIIRRGSIPDWSSFELSGGA